MDGNGSYARGTIRVKVYSNQPTVTLYVNNEVVGVKTGYRVFEFEAALAEGQNQLVVIAGDAAASVSPEADKYELFQL